MAVGQFQVPVGYVRQVRIRPVTVILHLKDGTAMDLPVDNPTLPSWKQSGWKIASEAGHAFRIQEDEMTGMRGLMDFGDRFVTPQNPKGIGWKIKPTIDAEEFQINPLPGEPGVYLDQITVVFKPSTSPSTIDAINAEIGSSIWRAPIASNAYRIKLPASITLSEAFEFFKSKPEVQGVMPATNYAPFQVVPDTAQDAHDIANLPDAWDFMDIQTGSVGSRTVRIAVVDTGVNLAHPELYLNIAINQGELPVAVFDSDADGDGLITFVDLNDPAFAAALPADVNANGFMDGEDVLADPAYRNGLDEDGNGFTDDLVGWDFENVPLGDPDPTPVWDPDGVYKHGTFVSQVAAAVGDNGVGIAGTAWHISIVPIRATAVSVTPDGVVQAMPDVAFLDAATYLEALGVDIINTSQGWHFASKKADLGGANCKRQATINIPQADFDNSIGPGEDAFRIAPWYDPVNAIVTSRSLYTFAAGNSTFNIGDPNILIVPAEFMKAVIPDNVLIVGHADARDSNDPMSGYGTNVELWAPGQWELIEYSGVGFAYCEGEPCEGTSFAAPTVAGVASLILSALPALVGAPDLLHARLLATADEVIDVVVSGSTREENRPLVNGHTAVSVHHKCLKGGVP